MRILRIITRLNVGGPARQAIDLNRELQKRGHTCGLISGFTPKNEGKYFEQELYERANFSVILHPSIKREIGWHDFKAFFFIRRVIIERKIDIVHTHMSKAGFLARLAAITIPKKRRPKLIHTFHGHVLGGQYFGWSKTLLFRILERWLSKHTDAVITISKTQAEELEGYGIRNLALIPLGFDLSKFLSIEPWRGRWKRYSTPTLDRFNVLWIGIVGRLCNIKNHELFFKFCNALRKVSKEYNWIIESIVVGDGERRRELGEKYYDAFFMGWQDKMEEVYKLLDIVVCSSKSEGTPASVIEAMASGRLVIGPYVGGLKDLLKDGRGFFLGEDVEACAKVVKYSLTTGDYEKRIERARNYTKREHQLSSLVDKVEELYSCLLDLGVIPVWLRLAANKYSKNGSNKLCDKGVLK